ncbi:MAG: cold-shock protein [Desulfobulbus sp.]|jgi:cold shock CspA family protein/ribosome-associated translation inhibitor RaiA
MELKVEAKNLDIRKSWQEKIEEERQKLIRHHANLVLHLRVSIEATPGYKEGGYEVRLVAAVPNDTVVVKRWGGNVRGLLVETFDLLGAQLKEMVKKKQQSDKSGKGLVFVEDSGVQGIVRKLFPDESYGFIVTDDKQDVFFHANALRNVEIGQLAEGDEVLFAMEQGDKGLQAIWVRSAQV